jgi:hypothetical protein
MTQRENTTPTGSRAFVHTIWGICIVGLLLVPSIWTPWIHGNDGARYYSYCRSLWIDGDFDFRNEFDHYSRLGELEKIWTDPETGKCGNAVGIGPALFWSPFFLVAHGTSLAMGWPSDGYSTVYTRAVCFGSTLYGLLGLMLLAHLLHRRFGAWTVRIVLAAIWFGTPLWFYMYLHPSMSHACSFFAVGWLLWLCLREGRGVVPLRFFLVGLTSALIIVTRFNDGVFLLIAWVWAWQRIRESIGERKIRIVTVGCALFTVGFALGMLPQCLAWQTMHGVWYSGPRSYDLGKNFAIWQSPHLFDVLFSGRRGLFVWSPVLLLAVAGYARRLRLVRDPLEMAGAVAMLVQLWVLGGWSMWWGGASFGQRFFIDTLPLLAIGLAAFMEQFADRKALATVCFAVALCIAWSSGLAVQYIAKMIPREDPVTIRELVVNQFTLVPEWGLAHVQLLSPASRGQAIDRE